MVHITKRTADCLVEVLENLSRDYHVFHTYEREEIEEWMKELKREIRNANPSSK